MSVRRARQEIDAEEFSLWMAYFHQETWDFEGYHQTGNLIARIANMMGDKSATETDFMPLKDAKPKGLKPADAAKVFAARFGG